MMSVPKRYSYFLFGLIRSGFTCAIAAAIPSAPFMYDGITTSDITIPRVGEVCSQPSKALNELEHKLLG